MSFFGRGRRSEKVAAKQAAKQAKQAAKQEKKEPKKKDDKKSKKAVEKKSDEEGDFLPGIEENLNSFALNEKYSDTSFEVGTDSKEVIPAHKVLLAARSPVFAAMFYSKWKEASDSVKIPVPDIEPEIFREMLRCIYTDDAEVDHSNLPLLLEAANKYQVKGLVRACAIFMRTTIDSDNACELLDLTPDWMEPDEFVLKFIDEHIAEVLKSKGFEHLSERRLIELLKREELEAEEMELVAAVSRWAKRQCEVRELKETPDNLKVIAQDIVPNLRLPCVPLEDLALGVATTGLFDSLTLNSVFRYVALKAEEQREDERKIRPAGWETSVEGKREIARLEAEIELKLPKIIFPSKPRSGCGNYDVTWMETSDHYKGLRALPSPSGSTRFWLAVSQRNTFDQGKNYGTPRGYEWAKTEMWNSSTVLSSSSEYNYYGQGGWSGYEWRNITRHCFLFNDSVKTRKFVHAGNYATMGGFQDWSPTSPFAGLVLIKKGSWDPSGRRFKA